MIRDHDTIAAPATAAGGALAVIRISGEEALRICDRIFRGREPLAAAAGYTVHYGEIVDDGRVLDDVLVTVFRAPRSPPQKKKKTRRTPSLHLHQTVLAQTRPNHMAAKSNPPKNQRRIHGGNQRTKTTPIIRKEKEKNARIRCTASG